MKPLLVDLFCGSFGWSQGWLEMGGRVVGFDIEHETHHGPVPSGADLVLQDVRTIDGAQFKDASLILASSPCQEFSWRAMPWKKAKEAPPPYLGMKLFAQAERIQREAIEAAGRFIPMVQENVRGAQPWVGRARWHYGSFYLWGDVPALMPIIKAVKVSTMEAGRYPPDHPKHPAADGVKQGGDWFNDPASISRRSSSKSSARKAASARIAMIPPPLARHIARVYFPKTEEPDPFPNRGCGKSATL